MKPGTLLLAALLLFAAAIVAHAAEPREGQIVKAALDVATSGENYLRPDGWRAWQAGFTRESGVFVCDNGGNTTIQRGASQTVVLNQSEPRPVVAEAWSKAVEVTGSANSDYSLYLDLIYTDGTPDWGKIAPFSTGSHDWQRRQVVVFPRKPIKSLAFHLLLRRHGGKALFGDAALRPLLASDRAILFDGVPVVLRGEARAGFQVRDVAAGSDFRAIKQEAAGLRLDVTESQRAGATLFDVQLSDTTGRDRAVTLLYALPLARSTANAPNGGSPTTWFEDPRRSEPVEPGREYASVSQFRAGANGRLSRYPLAAAAVGGRGVALGIDMTCPAFYRLVYNSASDEFYLAYDLGLSPEKPTARVRFCRFDFDPTWGFRSALAQYYAIFPEQFQVRVKRQGLWMPFARISQVEGWEDFGFAFKEGNSETAWDDAHGIVTFRYTEPMTWWMRMPPETPRTLEAALEHARALAADGDRRAQALLTSGYHDAQGRLVARMRDTPWCDGAVWSMNSMPGVGGEAGHFRVLWNPQILEKLYGPQRTAKLDGEYVDSSEGYVTDELDFRREHFAAAKTPLCFSLDDRRPAIFRGLIAFEYVRALAADVHRMKRFMMANGAPTRLCWLTPWLDVLGTETNWNRRGIWRPMSDTDLLYRRALCKGRPYCFLQNTEFEQFPPERVEKYMKRSLAYGMFPGFFSHNASEGHYFRRPDLYNRDRPLFRKYVPLCRLVAEAGWEPITLAHSSDERVYVERFGKRYLTLLNDSQEARSATVRLDAELAKDTAAQSRDLVSGREVAWDDGRATLSLAAEDVALIELRP